MRTVFALLLISLPAAAQGSAYTFCRASSNSIGLPAIISYSGSLDLSAGTFALTVTGCPPAPESFGMFIYGDKQHEVPFANGYLCVQAVHPESYHMPPQALSPVIIVHSMAQSPNDFAVFAPGSSWNFQFWYRDPPAGGALSNLSNALHVDFAP